MCGKIEHTIIRGVFALNGLDGHWLAIMLMPPRLKWPPEIHIKIMNTPLAPSPLQGRCEVQNGIEIMKSTKIYTI